MTIDNSNTVYNGGGAQWKKLAALKDESRNNIFVFLTNGLSFNDAEEKELFDKMISGCAETGKRVFVIYGSDANSVDIENGVRYISLKNGPEITLDNFDNTMTDAEYLKFFVNGDDITYSYDKIIDLGR